MKKFILSMLILLQAKPAFANPACAVCTVAVGAFLGISRELGVDDTVVGVWFGAILMLLAFWLMKFSAGKKWSFKGINLLWVFLSFSTIIPIYTLDYIPYGQRTLLGIDSFLFSCLIGAVIVWGTDILYRYMKAKNGGHAHFPFEKVALPVVSLLIASIVFYYTVPAPALPTFSIE